MWCLKITFNFCINFKDWWYHIKITLQILKFVEFDIAQLNVGHFKMKIYSVKIELCRIRCKIHRTVLAYRKQGLCILIRLVFFSYICKPLFSCCKIAASSKYVFGNSILKRRLFYAKSFHLYNLVRELLTVSFCEKNENN